MPNTLPPAEIIKIRKHLGLTPDEFARLIDVSFEAVRSWESGRRRCTGPAAVLIQLLFNYPKVYEILRNR